MAQGLFTPEMQNRLDVLGEVVDRYNLRSARKVKLGGLQESDQSRALEIQREVAALRASRRNKLGSFATRSEQQRIDRDLEALGREREALGTEEHEPSVDILLQVYRQEPAGGAPWGWPGGGESRRDIGEFIALRELRAGREVPPELLADYPDLLSGSCLKPTA